MTTSRSRIALTAFFLVGFGIPWAGAIVARLHHVNSPQLTHGFMIAGAFCSVGGVLATYLESGASGLRDLAKRCVIYRVPVVWWIYALFLPLAVHVVATLIYAAAHKQVVSIQPANLFCQWWRLYIWALGLLQGPLAEELG